METKEKVVVFILSALIPLAFGFGYKARGEQVRIQEKIVEKIITETVEVEKKVEVIKYVKDTKKDYHRETTVIKSPDGTETTKTVVDNKTDTKEGKDTVKTVEVVKEVVVEKVVMKDKLIEPVLKNWRVSAMVGIQPEFNPLAFGKVVGGGAAERRIIGPVWVGIWALSSPAIGIKASLDF